MEWLLALIINFIICTWPPHHFLTRDPSPFTYCKLYRPRSPIPRKSVLGSSPWKPISHHCLEIRDSSGVLGFRNFHNWETRQKISLLIQTQILFPQILYTILLEGTLQSWICANMVQSKGWLYFTYLWPQSSKWSEAPGRDSKTFWKGLGDEDHVRVKLMGYSPFPSHLMSI